MKYLLIIAAVLIGVWLWRSSRRADQVEKSAPPPGPTSATKLAPMEIVACDMCAVHLPRSEALLGGQGIYCSDAHRKQAEG